MSRKRIIEARSPEYAYIGMKLATVREALGLSQAEASKLIGIPQGTYSGYETGTRRINLSMLQKIAKAYNVTFDWLIGSGSGLVGSSFDSLSASYSDEEQRKILASNLQNQIQLSGLDQKTISIDLDINPPTFNQWVNGKAVPSVNILRRLADYFGCTLSALIDPVDYSSSSEVFNGRERALILKYRTASPAIKEAVDKLLE